MPDSVGLKMEVLDEEKFKAALKDVSASVKLTTSEMKKLTADYNGNANSISALEAKDKTLNQLAEEQKKKIQMLREELERAKTAYGDDSTKVKELQTKLNDAETSLSKTNSAVKDNNKYLKEAKTSADNCATSIDKFGKQAKGASDDVKKFGDDVEKTKDKTSKFSTSLKNTFSSENIKASLGAIGIAAAGVLQSSIDKAAAAEKVTANLEQTLKSTGGAAGMTMDSLNKLTTQMVSTTTFSGSAVKEGEAMMLTFTQIGQDVFPQATQAMLDFATKMKVDPKDAAMTLGKALNDPANGLSKLTRAGVTFTDEQKKQITAMQKAGDTAGAQKMMLEELNKEFGGQAAAAADTYEGKQQQLKNTLNSVQVTIGQAILPVLQQLMTAMMPVIKKVAEFVQEHPKLTAGILGAVAAIGTIVGGVSMVNKVTSALNLGGIAGKIASFIPSLGLVGLAIAGVAVAAYLIITHWKEIKTFFKKLWADIKEIFSGVGDWFKDKFEKAKEGVQGAWSNVEGFFKGVWTGIKGAFEDPPGFFHKTFSTAKELATKVWDGYVAFYATLWRGIKQVMAPVGDWFKDKFSKAKEGATKAWDGYIGIYIAIWNGIKSVFANVGEWFQAKFSEAKNRVMAIWNAVPQLFASISSSISGAFTGIGEKIKSGFDSAINFFKNLPSKMWSWGKDMVAGFINGMKSMWGSLSTAASNGADIVAKKWHHSKPDEGPLADDDTYMPDMMQSFAEGIRKNTGIVSAAAKQAAAAVSDNLNAGTTINAAALTGYPAAAGGVVHVDHSGVITIQGVNDQGQMIATYNYVVDRIRAEGRMA